MSLHLIDGIASYLLHKYILSMFLGGLCYYHNIILYIRVLKNHKINMIIVTKLCHFRYRKPLR
jgi:hypothetical protein